MATLTISLPEPIKEWIDTQVEAGEYATTSDYLRDLVERDQERAEHDRRLEELRRIVDEGLSGGVSTRTREERIAEGDRIARARGLLDG